MRWYKLYKWQDTFVAVVFFATFFLLAYGSKYKVDHNFVDSIIDPMLAGLINAAITFILLVIGNSIYKGIKK